MKSLLTIVAAACAVAVMHSGNAQADAAGGRSGAAQPSAIMIRGAQIAPSQVINGMTPPLQAWTGDMQPMAVPAGVNLSRGDRQKSSTSNLMPFQRITPCRLIDTRTVGGAVGVGGYLGGGAFTAGTTRSYTINGKCGIVDKATLNLSSSTYAAVAVNIFAQPVGGTSGDVEMAEVASGSTVSLVYNGANANYQASAVIASVGSTGTFQIQDRFGSANIVVDVVGYFADFANTSDEFEIHASSSEGAIQAYADNFSFPAITANAGSSAGYTDVNGTTGRQPNVRLADGYWNLNFPSQGGILANNGGYDGANSRSRDSWVTQVVADATTICSANLREAIIKTTFTNGNPGAVIVITPAYRISNNATTLHNVIAATYAVNYSTAAAGVNCPANTWRINRVDGGNMVTDSAFNVMIVNTPNP